MASTVQSFQIYTCGRGNLCCESSTAQFPARPLAASNVLATDDDFRGKRRPIEINHMKDLRWQFLNQVCLSLSVPEGT